MHWPALQAASKVTRRETRKEPMRLLVSVSTDRDLLHGELAIARALRVTSLQNLYHGHRAPIQR
jgi:hypothetical protein